MSDRPGRTPPRPRDVGAVGADGARRHSTEGYSAASPSMDVSNTAGAGGASSQRGHGSVNEDRSRYLHPDPDGQIPR
jgi:hypothetical protein